MTERLTIARMGHRGDGVAEGPSGPIHVAFTLPGETVTVDPITGHADRKHLLHVDVASPDRIAPVCAHFGVCGGCAVQHWASDRYRAWKRQIVVAALAAAGLDPPVEDLVDAHGEGRRRMVLHARRGVRDILQVGFAAPRAHHVVPIDRCPILAPGLAPTIPIAWKLAEALQPLRKPLDLQFTATDTGLDVDVRGSGPLSPQREAALARIATDNRLARLTRHGELVAQSVAPTIRMGRANVPLPPGSFLQATAAAEAILAQRVVTHLGAAARVADLFCGVGPFALRVAETARVTACDSDQNATAALQRAASGASGLKPIDPVTRDLFRQPLLLEELKPFDAVVFDPPRAGAMTQAVQLAASRVPLIIGVSCNPGTFARDARILVDGGYRLVGVAPVDQFRYSHHVELVARFERG